MNLRYIPIFLLSAALVVYMVVSDRGDAAPEGGERVATVSGEKGETAEKESDLDLSIDAAKPLTLPLKSPRIVVEKRKRHLSLYWNGKIVRRYRVGLGFTPTGDKRMMGDGRTPEGNFYICQKNPYSRFYLSLGISYPSTEDAGRGLREKLITRDEHDRIIAAITAGTIPPWNTKLGGEVFIHGHGSHKDWTYGCVALDDRHMKELYDAIPEGVPVEIKP